MFGENLNVRHRGATSCGSQHLALCSYFTTVRQGGHQRVVNTPCTFQVLSIKLSKCHRPALHDI